MDLEGFKAAWQKQSVEGRSLSSPASISRSLQFLRTSAIRDLQRSEELSRLIFSFLFALLAIGASLVVMIPGAGRIAAWLFAAALLADGIAGVALLARRFRQPATATMLEFISREHRQVQSRLRFERYSRWLMLILAAIVLLLLVFAPRPVNLRDNALDALQRMAIVTAFLAVAWRRAKSGSREVCRELERYLKDLSTQ
jgi:hypothetical protein